LIQCNCELFMYSVLYYASFWNFPPNFPSHQPGVPLRPLDCQGLAMLINNMVKSSEKAEEEARVN
jgi:hypothetical protein